MRTVPEGEPHFALKPAKYSKNVRDSQEEKKPLTAYLSLSNTELDFLKQYLISPVGVFLFIYFRCRCQGYSRCAADP